MTKMRASACVEVCLETESRVSLLCEEYQHFFSQPTRLLEQIEKLRPLVGEEMAEQWRGQVQAGDWRSLVRGLLEHHYDPSYRRSISRNFQAMRRPSLSDRAASHQQTTTRLLQSSWEALNLITLLELAQPDPGGWSASSC